MFAGDETEMFPAVAEVTVFDATPNPANVTPLTVTLVPDAVGPKLAEAKSDPFTETSDVPVIFWAVPQVIVAAFSDWDVPERIRQAIAIATATGTDFDLIMMMNLRGNLTAETTQERRGWA
jgi:hypothetical protein